MNENETGSSGTPWDYAPKFALSDAAKAFAGRDASADDREEWMSVLSKAARNGEFPNAEEGSGMSLDFGFTEPPAAYGCWLISRADLRAWVEKKGMRGREYARFLFPTTGNELLALAGNSSSAAHDGANLGEREGKNLLRLVGALALLVVVRAGKQNDRAPKFGNAAQPNVSALADTLTDMLKSENISVSGLSDSTLRAKITDGLKLLRKGD